MAMSVRKGPAAKVLTRTFGAYSCANDKVIALSPVYLSDEWYAKRAPYAYGAVWPEGTQLAEFMGNLACSKMANQAASGAGSDLARRPRVFGMLQPENPEYAAAGDEFHRAAAVC